MTLSSAMRAELSLGIKKETIYCVDPIKTRRGVFLTLTSKKVLSEPCTVSYEFAI
jgi:hypothetical protein